MNIEFNSREPLYVQIISHIKKEVICGNLNYGDVIPSRRELAEELEVNPNTVQRAYKEMESLNMIKTERNSLSTIAIDEEYMKIIKREYIEENFKLFRDSMKAIKVPKEELIELIKMEY
ncbi:transcriptional regulator, GntR family [Hathewaya proteolytica DSM 3090]|uniref:Transcriptional regulator, GntR family n=1 Tax=Hathewaya proteolytica DSM 3090 TaxID=1121331 RepID=A0A1M6JGR5_9CLOT|nr:GntR family transcriptional regulator [Hathewaya proteolytica]SHJ45854.1 transcriptional regulator, GntR family [Hathewaya proteolytica DSM 3090]